MSEFQLLAVIGSFLSVFFLMLMMGISGTLGMAIPWMVGYFYIFWFKPAVNLELGIRWAAVIQKLKKISFEHPLSSMLS